uniref:CO dehydrogenase maturation factor n=3 Tax=Candidatus Bipolaricaulota TaxID=67810 RepID=H5SP21_9BACT|nr:CO dehydrogenase maturation factor [uncultured Acetothermia bacterium]BAL59030.1 CO dehydrogenase maturation factor [Candidatus Acetothermum autotrophicum]
MAFTIAVAGKGGVGKTTVAGLIVRALLERRDGPILAIDADPNTNFHQVLGLQVEMTIGDLREETLKRIKDLPPGVSKDQYLEYGLQQCLVESNGVDLLAMGRGEGPFCYCAVNHVLRRYIDLLSKNYKYVVLDNEAGLEHLSRRTTQDVNVLLVISDANPIALQAAARINKLADELQLRIGKRFLVLNNISDSLRAGLGAEALQSKIAQTGLALLGEIPTDETLLRLTLEGKPLSELPPTSPAKLAVTKILERILDLTPWPPSRSGKGELPSPSRGGGRGGV